MKTRARTVVFYLVVFSLAFASAVFWAVLAAYGLSVWLNLGATVGRIGLGLVFLGWFGYAVAVLPERMRRAGWY